MKLSSGSALGAQTTQGRRGDDQAASKGNRIFPTSSAFDASRLQVWLVVTSVCDIMQHPYHEAYCNPYPGSFNCSSCCRP